MIILSILLTTRMVIENIVSIKFESNLYSRYLFNTQVSGESNPEAYNRALRAGCRAVEIDCYDGDNGQPIVKHGYTFVKACSFETIIRFIEPNLFKASPYESFNNHSSHVVSFLSRLDIQLYWIWKIIVLLNNRKKWLEFYDKFLEVLIDQFDNRSFPSLQID